MFRSVHWTHDMIIVKWHLFIWHANGAMTINVILCWLFCRSGLCLVPSAIHLRSKLQATTILAGITIHLALRRIFWKILCVSNDDKCYVKTCLNQKNYKKFEFNSGNEERSVCPKANVFRRPIFSESRIFRSFRNCGFNTRHDYCEVTVIEFFESRICPNIYRMLRSVTKCGLNTRYDNREVTLIHLTRAQTLRSDKCATGSIHANGSMTINVIIC